MFILVNAIHLSPPKKKKVYFYTLHSMAKLMFVLFSFQEINFYHHRIMKDDE